MNNNNSPQVKGRLTRLVRLLPCPFCGAEPIYSPRIQGPKEHGPGAYWPEMVSCHPCRITFRRQENGVTDPVEKWNDRSHCEPNAPKPSSPLNQPKQNDD